jgi:hypothetical protein
VDVEERKGEWIPCGGGFIAADVIRWRELVWRDVDRRGSVQAVNTGERVVMAEVVSVEGDWVELLVRGCTVASEMPGWKLEPLENGVAVRRKRRTIERGKPERLLWSDEGVRALLVSRFPTPDNPGPSEDDH